MRHTETRTVLSTWNALRGERRAPKRSEVEPRRFAKSLAFLLLLEKAGADDAHIRLAGTAVCGLFARELRGETLSGLWSHGARLSIQNAVQRVFQLGQPLLIEAIADTSGGRTLPMEVLLLPLADEQGHLNKALVMVQPLASMHTLVGEPVVRLRFVTISEPKVQGEETPAVASEESKAQSPARAHLRLVVSRPLAMAGCVPEQLPRRSALALQLM